MTLFKTKVWWWLDIWGIEVVRFLVRDDRRCLSIRVCEAVCMGICPGCSYPCSKTINQIFWEQRIGALALMKGSQVQGESTAWVYFSREVEYYCISVQAAGDVAFVYQYGGNK